MEKVHKYGHQAQWRAGTNMFRILLSTWVLTVLPFVPSITKADTAQPAQPALSDQRNSSLSAQRVVLRRWAVNNSQCGRSHLNEIWPSDRPIRQWEGVTVMRQDVVKVKVPFEHICTELPAAITALLQLTELDFSITRPSLDGQKNNITRILPSEWSALTLLAVLKLDGVPGLVGSIPPAWSHLVSLKHFSAADNSLTGSLPSSWSSFVHLSHLDLASNNIQGSLPAQWSRLSTVQTVLLRGNSITGPLPPEWKTLTNLEDLNMNSNELTSTLPKEWSSLANLKQLKLNGNSFRGSLPVSWSALSNLEHLDLEANKLISGRLPPEWSILTEQFSYLSLSSNSLTGTLPAAWSSLAQLQSLSLSANKLKGPIPTAWGEFTSLTELDLMFNQLTGTLPSAFSMLDTLQSLKLTSNQLKGTLPAEWGKGMFYMARLWLDGNWLTGSLPDDWADMFELRDLYLSSNQLQRSLPESWQYLEKLETLALDNNLLSGSLPASWSVMRRLDTLFLANNFLNQSLPAQWSALRLEEIVLSNNQLSGSIPSSWLTQAAAKQPSSPPAKAASQTQSLTKTLTYLELSNNTLTGPLASLPPNLKYINVSRNSMSSALPPFPESLVYAQFNDNKFTGPIPNLTNSSKLLYLNIANNSLSKLPDVFDAPKLALLAASNNNLSGSISADWKVKSLIFADLCNNFISGSLPTSWSTQSWVYLSLDNNRLVGSLPDPWLSNTLVFTARFNRLSGCLPSSWKYNNTALVLAFSHNALACVKGFPPSWGGQPYPSFKRLAVLELNESGKTGVIPKAWLNSASFPQIVELDLGNLWEQSARYNEKWRREVCIDKRAYAKASKLAIDNITKTFTQRVNQALTNGLAALTIELGRNANFVVFATPPVELGLPVPPETNTSFSATTQRRQSSVLDEVCSNQRAKLIVAIQYISLSAVLICLFILYWLSSKFYWHGWIRAQINRYRQQVVGSPMSPPQKPAASSGRTQLYVLGRMMVRWLRLAAYWADIVLDIVLLTRVWGNWPGWALLSFLLLHYIVASTVIAARLWQHGRKKIAALTLVLTPLQPLLDTLGFMVAALQEAPDRWRQHPCLLWWQIGPLAPLVEDWRKLLDMREVLEVLLEAVPTSVLQSVVYILGNKPSIGWYLTTYLYVLLAASSCIQIIRVVALVLWEALMKEIPPWQALWRMVSFEMMTSTAAMSPTAPSQTQPHKIIESRQAPRRPHPIRAIFTGATRQPASTNGDMLHSPVSTQSAGPIYAPQLFFSQAPTPYNSVSHGSQVYSPGSTHRLVAGRSQDQQPPHTAPLQDVMSSSSSSAVMHLSPGAQQQLDTAPVQDVTPSLGPNFLPFEHVMVPEPPRSCRSTTGSLTDMPSATHSIHAAQQSPVQDKSYKVPINGTSSPTAGRLPGVSLDESRSIARLPDDMASAAYSGQVRNAAVGSTANGLEGPSRDHVTGMQPRSGTFTGTGVASMQGVTYEHVEGRSSGSPEWMADL